MWEGMTSTNDNDDDSTTTSGWEGTSDGNDEDISNVVVEWPIEEEGNETFPPSHGINDDDDDDETYYSYSSASEGASSSSSSCTEESSFVKNFSLGGASSESDNSNNDDDEESWSFAAAASSVRNDVDNDAIARDDSNMTKKVHVQVQEEQGNGLISSVPFPSASSSSSSSLQQTLPEQQEGHQIPSLPDDQDKEQESLGVPEEKQETTTATTTTTTPEEKAYQECPHCHFYNLDMTTIVCEMCHLGLRAMESNPTPIVDDNDEMLARYLQQQERVDAALRQHQYEETHYHPTPTPPTSTATTASDTLTILEQAQGFSNELYDTLLGKFSSDDSSYSPLPKEDLVRHLIHFLSIVEVMKESGEFSKLSIQYKCCMHSASSSITRMWNAIRLRGFARDGSIGFKEPVHVTKTLQGAWSHEMMIQMDQHNDKYTYHEDDDDDDEPSPYWMWMVAVAESTTSDKKKPARAERPMPCYFGGGQIHRALVERGQQPPPHGSGTDTITNLELSEQVLPIICFDPKTHGNDDDIRILMNGLQRILVNRFINDYKDNAGRNKFGRLIEKNVPANAKFQDIIQARQEQREKEEQQANRVFGSIPSELIDDDAMPPLINIESNEIDPLPHDEEFSAPPHLSRSGFPTQVISLL